MKNVGAGRNKRGWPQAVQAADSHLFFLRKAESPPALPGADAAHELMWDENQRVADARHEVVVEMCDVPTKV
jgi:hypothetical protein